jgi:hypothetical protein
MEAANSSLAEYQQAVANITSLLKPGGHIFVAGMLDQTYYNVGKYKFTHVKTSKEDIQRIYSEAGYAIERWQEIPEQYKSPVESNPYSDFGSAFVLVGKKVK